MLQTSNIVFQTVNLTDELKIGLEYDLHGGALNIFVKNTGEQMDLPYQINILSNRSEQCVESVDDNDSFDYQTGLSIDRREEQQNKSKIQFQLFFF